MCSNTMLRTKFWSIGISNFLYAAEIYPQHCFFIKFAMTKNYADFYNLFQIIFKKRNDNLK